MGRIQFRLSQGSRIVFVLDVCPVSYLGLWDTRTEMYVACLIILRLEEGMRQGFVTVQLKHQSIIMFQAR